MRGYAYNQPAPNVGVQSYTYSYELEHWAGSSRSHSAPPPPRPERAQTSPNAKPKDPEGMSRHHEQPQIVVPVLTASSRGLAPRHRLQAITVHDGKGEGSWRKEGI